MGMGLRKFKEQGVVAITRELKQIHNLQTFIPMYASALTEEEKKRAIPLLMFVTEKRCGTVKARKCANGSKQREYIKTEDSSSPTVCLDSTLITGVIEAIENGDVAIIDLPDAFLHADLENNDQVQMVMEGRLAELMAMTEPKIY